MFSFLLFTLIHVRPGVTAECQIYWFSASKSVTCPSFVLASVSHVFSYCDFSFVICSSTIMLIVIILFVFKEFLLNMICQCTLLSNIKSIFLWSTPVSYLMIFFLSVLLSRFNLKVIFIFNMSSNNN